MIKLQSFKLPSWNEVSEKRSGGFRLNPLERFIYDNEPCSMDDRKFRKQLIAMILFVLNNRGGNNV